MTYLHRRIFKSQTTGAITIQELLQTMFVGEMLRGDGDIWIVSPWISNVVLIDNRSGNFDSVNPEWGRREVRLADVLIALMARGTSVTVVTRSDEINRNFLTKLNELVEQQALEDCVELHVRKQLHTKGILLTSSLLMGSMNLTYNGMVINDEWVEFSLDSQDLARTKLEFMQYMEVR
ncbi:phospholipase D-like domain-containing protein DpdK [Caballeronia sp. LjRoot34]|uniref:phospholipase D-like domain-containing protein DpdK n=1 Tax=Caballeronia sp. LjRoot34 TaxID=3342325 RepID=UPI003ECF78B6